MGILTGDISRMIFRQVVGDHLKEVSLNGRLLSIFLEMDGKRSLGSIARSIQLNSSDMSEAVSRLLNLELIELVRDSSAVIDDDFLKFLTLQFAKAIGPLSRILVEEAIQTAGFSLKSFPAGRVAELVETLAQEIQREDIRHQFRNRLLQIIQQKGYDQPSPKRVQQEPIVDT